MKLNSFASCGETASQISFVTLSKKETGTYEVYKYEEDLLYLKLVVLSNLIFQFARGKRKQRFLVYI